MQTEGNQRAFDDAVNREGERGAFMHRPMREGIDAIADRWPDEAEQRADEYDGERSDDRHRALAGEEAEIRRELYSIEAVETPGRDDADDDAAEDAGLDRGDAHDRFDLDTAQSCADAECSKKHDVARGACKCGDAVVFS